MKKLNYILFFNQISLKDISKVGGKNASLGELYNRFNPIGINITNGFAVTASSYRLFRSANNLEKPLNDLLLSLDKIHYYNLEAVGQRARSLIMAGTFPKEINEEISQAYKQLSKDFGGETINFAVRIS